MGELEDLKMSYGILNLKYFIAKVVIWVLVLACIILFVLMVIASCRI